MYPFPNGLDRGHALGALALTAALGAWPAAALDGHTSDPRAVLQAVYERDTGDRVQAELHMTIVEGGARKTRSGRQRSMQTDEGRRTLMVFDAPGDVRGTAFLNYDYDDGARQDDQWLYLKSLGRTTRITAAAMAGAFMGSDLSYADLSQPDPDLYELTMVDAEAEVDGEACWVVDAVPRAESTREQTGYAKTRLWISKEKHLPLQVQAWVIEGRKLKYLKVTHVERIDGIWTPTRLVARTARAGKVLSETLLETRSIRYGSDAVRPTDFSPNRLAQGL